MDSFFHAGRLWPRNPFPHFLVVLSVQAFQGYAEAHRELLQSFAPQLVAVPARWLHATVQGIHHTVSSGQLDAVARAAGEALAGMESFTVECGPTWPGVTSVTVAMYPETGFAELNRRVRIAAASVPGIRMRPAEKKFWAHSSLAYAKDSFDSKALNRRLRDLRPDRVEVTVDRVQLVNQYQRPDLGYYTWKLVQEYRLAGGVR